MISTRAVKGLVLFCAPGGVGFRGIRSLALAFLCVALAGCAAELASRPGNPPSEVAPYVGVFTGEFVDGKPLYRLPSILVVGSRLSVRSDI